LFKVQKTVDDIRKNLDGIVSLSNQWVQFATEKNLYEHTERHHQIQAQIHATAD
jgi:hypothetical protein